MDQPTALEEALGQIIKNYNRFAIRQNHSAVLTQGGVKQLMEDDFGNWLKNPENPGEVKQLFQELDKDKDKPVPFKRYMGYLAGLAVATQKGLQ